jgi:hypothetical protein
VHAEIVPLSPAETLLRYSRLIAIVAEQLQAAAEGDRERMLALLDERRLIDDELSTSKDEENAPELTIDELLNAAVAEVAETLEADRLDKDQWLQISSGALTSARTLSLRPAAVAGRYPEPGARGERLDLRF